MNDILCLCACAECHRYRCRRYADALLRGAPRERKVRRVLRRHARHERYARAQAQQVAAGRCSQPRTQAPEARPYHAASACHASATKAFAQRASHFRLFLSAAIYAPGARRCLLRFAFCFDAVSVPHDASAEIASRRYPCFSFERRRFHASLMPRDFCRFHDCRQPLTPLSPRFER